MLHDKAQQQRSPWLPKPLQQRTKGRAFKIAARPSYDAAKSDSQSRRQCKEKHNSYPLSFFFLGKHGFVRVKHQSLLRLDLFYRIQRSCGSCKQ